MAAPLIAAGIAAGSAVMQGIFGADAAKQQQHEANLARMRQDAILSGDRERQAELAEQQQKLAARGRREGERALAKGFETAEGRLEKASDITGQAGEQAKGELGAGTQAGREDLQTGLVGAESSFERGAEELLAGEVHARQALDPALQLGERYETGATQAVQGRDLTGARSRLEEFYEGGPDALKNNPAYQARMDAAMEAADAMASATGGRFSSAAMDRRQKMASRLASEEYEAAFGRAGKVDEQQQSLLASQAKMEQEAKLEAQRNQMGLSKLGYDTTGTLADVALKSATERSNLQGQTAEARLGTGQDLSKLAEALGINLAGVTGQTGQDLSSLQQLMGKLGYGYGTDVAGLADTETERRIKSLDILGAREQTSNLAQAGVQAGAVPFAGGQSAAYANTAGKIGEMTMEGIGMVADAAGAAMGAGAGIPKAPTG